MNEGQRPWGDSVDYKNLLNDYRSMIDDGQKLYLSNAYITHQQSVVEDYESYKDEFGLELVLEGCLGACNLYLLSL